MSNYLIPPRVRRDLMRCKCPLRSSGTCCTSSCHSSAVGDKLTMPPSSRFKRRDSDLSDKLTKPNVLTRSPPSSPQISEGKSHPREPYPVPSNNPANQYTLLEKLGTGSFGTVYKAIHNETEQIVAIKQIGESASFFKTEFSGFLD
jgi:hypothetical protein